MSTEQTSNTPETPNPEEQVREGAIADVRKELADLQAVLEPDWWKTKPREQVDPEAQEVMNSLAALEEADPTQAESLQDTENLIAKYLANELTVEQLRNALEQNQEVREELNNLAREVNENNGEAANMPGNPELTGGAVIMPHAERILDALKGTKLEEWSAFIEGMLYNLMESLAAYKILGMALPIPKGDLNALAERRFDEQVERLKADPNAKQKFEQDPGQYEGQYKEAYKAWVVVQKKDEEAPSLKKIVLGTAEEAAEADEENESQEAGIFASDQTEKVIGDSDFVNLDIEGKRLTISKKNAELKLDGGSIKVRLENAGGTDLEIEKILREEGVTTPTEFRVEAGSGAGSFTLAKLVDALKKNEERAEIESTEINVVKV